MNPYLQYMYSYPHKTAYRPLQGVNLTDYGHRLRGPGHGLYLHVPFCQTKCGYCNLFSVTGAGEAEMEQYLDGVERQIRQYEPILSSEKTSFADFTIGGGTPLLLTERQLDRMFSMVNRSLRLEKDLDIVIETAPNQTCREKLRFLQMAGVTRVSMGIQSFDAEELKTLRRGHSPGKAREALELLMSFGFACVNLDFIYGIPGQKTDSLLRSLKEAVAFGPQEIFLYPLYVKHGVSLEQEGMVPEPEKAYGQYRECSSFLRSEGFRQDSMRRFVRCGEQDSLERSVWCGERDSVGRSARCERRAFSECGFSTSLALGCGGRSYLGNLHFCTPYAITRQDCLRELETFTTTKNFTEITHGIFLSEEEQKRRYVIRHLLIRPGVDEVQYRQRFGSGILDDFPVIMRWMKEDYVTRENDRYLTLTDEGMGLSDYLGPQLISENVRRKMDEWEMAHTLMEEGRDVGEKV